LFFIVGILYSDDFTQNLNKNYKLITGNTEVSKRAFNEIKMLYIDAILNNNLHQQKQSIEKLISGSKKLNIDIPAEYLEEFKKLNSDPYSSLLKISARDANSKLVVQDVYAKNNKIVVKVSKNIEKRHIKVSHWNTNKRYRNIYEFKGILSKKSTKKIRLSSTLRVNIAQYKSNTTRIVISDSKKLYTNLDISGNKIFIYYKKYNYASVKPKKVYKKQILPNKNINQNSFTRIVPTSIRKNILNSVIVIDPGHGGGDPGAVGYKRFKEKNIVLGIAKFLYKTLKKQGYKKVYLTRNRDIFIKLRNRTRFANNKKADIFISIHANSIKSKKVQGIETYFLSPARSRRAKMAAAKENKEAIKYLGFSSKNIFLDVLNKSRLVASNKLAIDIHKNIKFEIKKKIRFVKDHGVRSGPFWVLVGAQMPSVLVEVGYLTNKKEAKMLSTKNYQRLIALGIANGISSYFAKNK